MTSKRELKHGLKEGYEAKASLERSWTYPINLGGERSQSNMRERIANGRQHECGHCENLIM